MRQWERKIKLGCINKWYFQYPNSFAEIEFIRSDNALTKWFMGLSYGDISGFAHLYEVPNWVWNLINYNNSGGLEFIHIPTSILNLIFLGIFFKKLYKLSEFYHL